MVTFILLQAIFSTIGASTGNLFWFGIDQFIVSLQVILMTLLLNVSICKLTNYLKQLNQEQNSLGTTGTNFRSAMRKMLYVRVISISLTIIVFSYSIFAPGGAKDRTATPFTPIVIDNRTFAGQSLVTPTMICLIHSMLLYMLRRPQSKSEKSSKSGEKPTEISSARLSELAVSATSPTTAPMKTESPVIASSDIMAGDIPTVIDMAE